MSALRSLGVYVHIPVCASLCGYCDFYSVKESQIDSSFWKNYLEKLKDEFYFKQPDIAPNLALASVYFGGGTPSLSPRWFLNDLLNFIFSNIPKKTAKVEISTEANPETITSDLLKKYSDSGFNRLSMGVQSLNDDILKRLERSVDRNKNLDALEFVSNGPINNWNADVIYGIPGQTSRVLVDDIELLAGFGPGHISAYSLTLEANTIGNKAISGKRQYEHQKLLWELLPSLGFEQYEISNFAKISESEDYKCVHNLSVWKYRPYVSLGTSGHSFINGKRFRTISDIAQYLKQPLSSTIIEQKSSAVPDLFISALRLKQKQGFGLFKRNLSENQFRDFMGILRIFEKDRWLDIYKNGFSISTEGLKFSNIMLQKVYEILS